MPEHDTHDLGPFASFDEETRTMTLLPPEEIRRLGDRRRHRRRAGTGALLAGVTALAISATLLLQGNPTTIREPEVASPYSTVTTPSASPTGTRTTSLTSAASPSGTTPPSSRQTTASSPGTTTGTPVTTTTTTGPGSGQPAPTWSNVPTLDQVFPRRQAPARQTSQYTGAGQSARGLCDPGTTGGARTVLTREFEFTTGGGTRWATVFGFGTSAEASAHFTRLVTAAATCKAQLTRAGFGSPRASQFDDLPFDGSTVQVRPTRAAYLTASGSISGSEEGMYNDTLVVQAGNRLVWVVSTFRGLDNNCGAASGGDVQQCDLPYSLPAMLTRLAA